MKKNENNKTIESQPELSGALKKKDKAFVLFYASWCPFSQRFLPVFDKFAKDNMDNCLRVMIDDSEDVCKKYKISVYPTVLYFKKGKVAKRLDGVSGEGLNEKKLTDFIGACGG
ncbi:MAG: thioredoxin family protein [Candidatus Saganbacteria bacterium]|nr:thioredoxin family protein [Candidatus Saganbacteria bacterium]